MLQKLSKKDRRYLEKGNVGESFIRWYCMENNITYKKATMDENIEMGIDCYIEQIPIDIKNTKGIYFGRIYIDSGKFYTRHPFRKDTKAENYIILDIINNLSFNIVYDGPIKDYLIEKYFTSEKTYTIFVNLIQSMNDKNYHHFQYSSQGLYAYGIKKKIEPLLKKDVLCNYTTINEKNKEISLKLITLEDRILEKNYLNSIYDKKEEE